MSFDVLSVSLVEKSQGWVSLILRDYHFIHPRSMNMVVFHPLSPSQYITSPVTCYHNLFINCVAALSWYEATYACFWLFFPHLWISLAGIHILCVFVSVLTSQPPQLPPMGNSIETCLWHVDQFGAYRLLAFLEYFMSTQHSSVWAVVWHVSVSRRVSSYSS